MLTWTECHVAQTNHRRQIAKADAIGWMSPRGAKRPLLARLTAALVALSPRHSPSTGSVAPTATASLPAEAPRMA